MTANRRIALNIVATYGRSLFAMLCGIFTSRWVLMSLGQEDYGLYGLIGGLLMFVTFINGTLSGAVARYYAVTIGARSVASDVSAALEECRRWFSLAVMLHLFFPVLLLAIGYPIGIWAIENWLNIPADRIDACRWVLCFVSLSSLVAMFNVPFSALYTAKQYIAELTIYSFISTIANVLFVVYMVNHEGVWLAKYALAMCLTAIIPQVLICLRACYVFEEARFRFRYCFDWPRLKQLFQFAAWQMFGTVSMLVRCQTLSIVTNKSFGPRFNSSMSIATLVNSQCGTLAASMFGAFSPAVMSEYGAGNYARAQALAQRACKYGAAFFLLFSLPLMLEMDYVINLWLVEPPPYCVSACILVLAGTILEQMVVGTGSIINATGRIRNFQVASGIALLLTIPISIMLVAVTHAFLAMPITIVVVAFLFMIAKLYAARKDASFSIRAWLKRVALPITLVSIISAIPGFVVMHFIEPSFGRLVLTTAVVLSTMALVSWKILIEPTERELVLRKLYALRRRFTHGE